MQKQVQTMWEHLKNKLKDFRKVSTRGEKMEIRVRKLIFGIMPPQVKHPTLVERLGIRHYMRNNMLHMMLKMGYIMPMIHAPEIYYLVHHFQIYI
jgi:hypothetical protein